VLEAIGESNRHRPANISLDVAAKDEPTY